MAHVGESLPLRAADRVPVSRADTRITRALPRTGNTVPSTLRKAGVGVGLAIKATHRGVYLWADAAGGGGGGCILGTRPA